MRFRPKVWTTALLAFCSTSNLAYATGASRESIKAVVDSVIEPLKQQYRIPGVAAGIIAEGRAYVFNYGVASLQTKEAVTDDTLFELGSVTKTFTATLASYAQVKGYLSLSDTTGKYLPALQGSKFGNVTLLELATHTTGGLPLQVPDDVRSDDQLMAYLKQWVPSHVPGKYRTYSNISIGLLGLVTAKSANRTFEALMTQDLFSPLGLTSTYIDVPPAQTANYAQGYTADGSPVRLAPRLLWSEAYGIRATAADVLVFLEANMKMLTLGAELQRAITETHRGYFKSGSLTQDLIWEQYPKPVKLKALLKGNSRAMLFGTMPAAALTPPEPPRNDVWIDKTGSTNGFGAYVAFVPERRSGIVILTNRNVPIAARVRAAYAIMGSLGGSPL